MAQRSLILAFALTGLMASAQAMTPQQQYKHDTKEAAARYAEDRSICDDEKNQGQRMKCLRAAKEENNKALAAAKANLKAAGGAGAQGKMACLDCGKVTGVRMIEKDGEGNALGVVAGGAAGALLGNQVGGGSGKTLATIAGAVGGAYAGKKIQEKANSTKVWAVDVQYDNGQRGTYNFDQDPGLSAGVRVKSAGQSIARY